MRVLSRTCQPGGVKGKGAVSAKVGRRQPGVTEHNLLDDECGERGPEERGRQGNKYGQGCGL